MKPYQVHLFTDESKIPEYLPSRPSFIYEDKRYLNFLVFDCFNLKTNDYLKEIAESNIKEYGIVPANGSINIMEELRKAMSSIKKLDSILIFPDEMSALYSVFSVINEKATLFIDYETSPFVVAALQNRNVEYYHHGDIEQLAKLLSAKSEKVVVLDGVYEWIGNMGPINQLIKVAQENEAMIIANELSSFGFLGRNGQGFIDLFNCYDAITIDIGSYSRFLGGFGCYIGAKKFLINKIKENAGNIIKPLPQFMLAVSLGGLEFIASNKVNKDMHQKLWKNSRYFISRLKQIGFSTESETPIVVVSFNNNEEAGEFTKRLFFEQIIVAQNKERVRLCLSIEHSKEDLDYCLEKCEAVGEELGILQGE